MKPETILRSMLALCLSVFLLSFTALPAFSGSEGAACPCGDQCQCADCGCQAEACQCGEQCACEKCSHGQNVAACTCSKCAPAVCKCGTCGHK